MIVFGDGSSRGQGSNPECPAALTSQGFLGCRGAGGTILVVLRVSNGTQR